MEPASSIHKLERDVRFLKIYAAVATVVIVVLVSSAFTSRKSSFDHVTVHRLDIVEPDGKPVMVISNREQFPPPIVNGKVLKRSGTRDPGILFYNKDGDEDGGLVYNGYTKSDGSAEAGAALLFDQYKSDQTIGILYGEENSKRQSALKVWDHDTPMNVFEQKVEAMEKMPEGPAKEAARKEVHKLWGTQRVFLGKNGDRSAELLMSDTEGNPRLRLRVGADGAPELDFLDASGKTIDHLPRGK